MMANGHHFHMEMMMMIMIIISEDNETTKQQQQLPETTPSDAEILIESTKFSLRPSPNLATIQYDPLFSPNLIENG